MEELYKRIKDSKSELKLVDTLVGPGVLGVIGVLLIPVMIGLLLLPIAIIWAFWRTNQKNQLKTQIFQYETELYRLQGI